MLRFCLSVQAKQVQLKDTQTTFLSSPSLEPIRTCLHLCLFCLLIHTFVHHLSHTHPFLYLSLHFLPFIASVKVKEVS